MALAKLESSRGRSTHRTIRNFALSLFALLLLSTRGGSHAREPPFSCAGNGSRDNYRCDIINYQTGCTARTQVSDCRMYRLAALYALKCYRCRWQSVRRFIALNLGFLRMTALGWKTDNRFRPKAEVRAPTSTFRIDRGQRQDRILGFGGEYSSKMG